MGKRLLRYEHDSLFDLVALYFYFGAKLTIFSFLLQIFVSMVRARRRQYLEKITKQELMKLDSRINSGEVLEAAMNLDFSKSKL